MKKKYLLLLSLLLSFSLSAQSSGKIKGNKILDVVTREIDPYRILEIGEEFEVVLVKQETPKVRIQADSNLLEHIKVDVSSEKLSILTSENISRFKKMYVEIGYNDSLSKIIANDKVTIRGNTLLEVDRVELIVNASANLDLNFQSSRVEITGSDKAKINASITAESVAIHTSGNAKITSNIITESLNVNLSENTDLNISGTTPKSVLFLQDSSKLSATELSSSITTMSSKGKSKAYVKVTDKFNLSASEVSETYLLSNPLIEITSFSDEAKLIKIKKAPSGGLGRFLK